MLETLAAETYVVACTKSKDGRGMTVTIQLRHGFSLHVHKGKKFEFVDLPNI